MVAMGGSIDDAHSFICGSIQRIHCTLILDNQMTFIPFSICRVVNIILTI